MHFVRYFRRIADVDLACSVHDGAEIVNDGVFRRVLCIPSEGETSELYRNLQFFGYRLPWCVLMKYSAAFKRRILKIIAEEQYDLIFIRYAIYGQYFLTLPVDVRNRVCLDVDDVLSGSVYDEMNAVATRFKLKQWLDRRYIVEYERRCCDRLGHVLFCSQDDLDSVAGVKRANRYVVPNVVNVRPAGWNEVLPNPEEHSLLFVGVLNYQPNAEAICWFVDEIFSEFKKTFPTARLSIVGRKPQKDVQALVARDGVAIFPDVPDVEPYYEKNAVVVVPILQGAGTRIKILEAACMSRPVLSTWKGAEGIDFDEDEEILIFRDAESFIRQYRKLLNPDFYMTMVKKAQQKVESRYSPQAICSTLDNIFL